MIANYFRNIRVDNNQLDDVYIKKHIHQSFNVLKKLYNISLCDFILANCCLTGYDLHGRVVPFIFDKASRTFLFVFQVVFFLLLFFGGWAVIVSI